MEKNYTKYDEIDFAEEPSFIRWVQGKDQKATAFWKNWMATHPEKTKEVKAAKALIQSIKILEKEPSESQIKNLWDKIDAATPTDEARKIVVRSIERRRWLSYAAAACIAFVAFFVYTNLSTNIQTNNGEHLAYTLPDKSKVELNAASSISFKKNRFASDRTINLKGEAFFSVEKGSTFEVITPYGNIEVLGTRFNVYARNGRLVVHCEEGKVKVTAKGDTKILTQGLSTKLNPKGTGLVETYSSDLTKQTSWRTGEFYFEKVSYGQVIEELERQFDVTVDIAPALKGRMGNYTFKNTDLKEALDEIVYPLNASYRIEGRRVIIE